MSIELCSVCWSKGRKGGGLKAACEEGCCTERGRILTIAHIYGELRALRAAIQPEPVCSCDKDGGMLHSQHGPMSETEFRIKDVARWFGVSPELLTRDHVQQASTAFRERLEYRHAEACRVAGEWFEEWLEKNSNAPVVPDNPSSGR